MVKRRKKETQTVKTDGLLRLLKESHLGGALQEFVLTVDGGQGVVEAVDMTNSLVVMGKSKVFDDDVSAELGLGNIDLLIGFLSKMDDKLSITIKENRMEVMQKDGRRKLSYLLTRPDLIGTRLNIEDEDEGDDPLETFEEMMVCEVELTEAFIKDFLGYISILGTKDTIMEFDGLAHIAFICGGSEDHQARLELEQDVDNTEGKKARKSGNTTSFQLHLSGEHLASVLGVIEYDKKNPPLLLFVDDDKPILIKTKKTSWALMPIVSEEPE